MIGNLKFKWSSEALQAFLLPRASIISWTTTKLKNRTTQPAGQFSTVHRPPTITLTFIQLAINHNFNFDQRCWPIRMRYVFTSIESRTFPKNEEIDPVGLVSLNQILTVLTVEILTGFFFNSFLRN